MHKVLHKGDIVFNERDTLEAATRSIKSNLRYHHNGVKIAKPNKPDLTVKSTLIWYV